MPSIVFDLHCDTADRLAWQDLPADIISAMQRPSFNPQDDLTSHLFRDLSKNGCHLSLERVGDVPWIQCFACFIPDELDPQASLSLYRFVEERLSDQVSKHAERAAFACSSDEALAAVDLGRLAVVRTIENARHFALGPDLVDQASSQGVIMASLSWNDAGPLASGIITNEGITEAGRIALGRMERNGMTLDVSHLNDRSFDEASRLYGAPIVATHSNSRAVCGHPRNLTDAQFDCIRERDGLVGLCYCTEFLAEDGNANFDDISRHIDHWLSRDGEDTIALGSDFDGCDPPSCISDATDMPSFQSLLERRFGRELTEKICGRNALRFFAR
ncbi:MAG: membrane dipeptidase [Collinsella sp.]|nr:membrane dipeptidase [Collinsella sp.]